MLLRRTVTLFAYVSYQIFSVGLENATRSTAVQSGEAITLIACRQGDFAEGRAISPKWLLTND
jgi:hypothetical protein